jgi:dsRNA-specific ribonuclease
MMPLLQVLRSAMNTNCTFMHYMLKVGAFEKKSTQQPGASNAFNKVAADAFETLIAAYYFEQGFQAVCAWVSDALKPLIIVARNAYDEL